MGATFLSTVMRNAGKVLSAVTKISFSASLILLFQLQKVLLWGDHVWSNSTVAKRPHVPIGPSPFVCGSFRELAQCFELQLK